MDKTYQSRLELRTSLLKSHPDVVVGVHDPDDPRIRAAVSELYAFVLGTYLPARYPDMFKLHATTLLNEEKATMLENRVTGEVWPVQLSERREVRRGLEILGKVVDEEFLILIPESVSGEDSGSGKKKEEEEEKYVLKAYVVCFPSGFNTKEKLGLRLADIHIPVPGYAEKLEKSMDRFFSKLEVGKFVKRVNWTVTTDSELFAAFGGVHGDDSEAMKQLKVDDLDLDSVCVFP